MDENESKSPSAALLSGDTPVVVKFTAAYCGPCRQLSPVLSSLAADYAGRVRVVTVDIEEQPGLAQEYGVRSVPTLLAFRGGRVVGQQVGYSSPRRVLELFSELASDSPR